MLNPGVTYDDFLFRLSDAIEPQEAMLIRATSNEPLQSSSMSQTTLQSDPPAQESTTSSTSENISNPLESGDPRPSSAQPSSTVQSLLQERRQRLEAERKASEEKEKAERIAKVKAKREAADAAAAGQHGGSRSAEADYAAKERRRKQDDRNERERVRQLVENDKIERREREARRKEALAAERQVQKSESHPQVGPSSSATVSTGTCAVQVRLFDGSTVRTRFDSPSTQTLASSIRKWVDSHLQSTEGGKPSSLPPYTFKHILTPLPNRTLEVGEEEKTLQDLGLTPTATLVLVPVQGYTDAYSSSGVSGWLGWLYGLVAGAFLFIVNALKGILGMIGATGAASPTQPVAPTRRLEETASRNTVSKDESRPSTKMKTLKDTKDERDPSQLYNGNQVCEHHLLRS